MDALEIRVLKGEAEYEAALAEVEKLMDLNPAQGTPDADRLELLALVVRDYEDRHFKIDVPDPIEAIKFRMEQMGLTRRDLEKYIGGRGKVSEVFGGKRRLSLAMIRALNAGLGIPAESLIRQPVIKRKPADRDKPARKPAVGVQKSA